jgi:hypothetical protein
MEIHSIAQFHAVREKESPTYIVYHSPTKCSSCKNLMTYLSNMSDTSNTSITYYTINVDLPHLSGILHDITILPTIEKYDYFECMDRLEGYSEEKLKTFFKSQ